jgi:uncharacterized protein
MLNINKKGLMQELRRTFRLDWTGIHGAPHWARVRHCGLMLSNLSGADLLVVELFAFLHDSHRQNDFRDPQHGGRAADYALSLNGSYFLLNRLQMDKLHYAISAHSDGEVHDDVTIQTCWDADRLDLWRVGKTPDPKYLSHFGRQLIEPAKFAHPFSL